MICDNPDELKAIYNYIQAKEGQLDSYPRFTTFNSSESHPVNLYWECVKTIRQHLYPEIEITCTLNDLQKLTETPSINYNVGDIITIQIPDRDILIPCRITKTIKKPDTPEYTQIEINTYHNSFLTDFYQKYSRGSDFIF